MVVLDTDHLSLLEQANSVEAQRLQARLKAIAPEEVAATLRAALRYVPAERLYPCTNCGMVPLTRDAARGKLQALAAGAQMVRRELGSP